MIAIFTGQNSEVIVVGLDSNGNPMDEDGTLFGPDSGRNIEDYEREDVDTDKGQIAHITPWMHVSVK